MTLKYERDMKNLTDLICSDKRPELSLEEPSESSLEAPELSEPLIGTITYFPSENPPEASDSSPVDSREDVANYFGVTSSSANADIIVEDDLRSWVEEDSRSWPESAPPAPVPISVSIRVSGRGTVDVLMCSICGQEWPRGQTHECSHIPMERPRVRERANTLSLQAEQQMIRQRADLVHEAHPNSLDRGLSMVSSYDLDDTCIEPAGLEPQDPVDNLQNLSVFVQKQDKEADLIDQILVLGLTRELYDTLVTDIVDKRYRKEFVEADLSLIPKVLKFKRIINMTHDKSREKIMGQIRKTVSSESVLREETTNAIMSLSPEQKYDYALVTQQVEKFLKVARALKCFEEFHTKIVIKGNVLDVQIRIRAISDSSWTVLSDTFVLDDPEPHWASFNEFSDLILD